MRGNGGSQVPTWGIGGIGGGAVGGDQNLIGGYGYATANAPLGPPCCVAMHAWHRLGGSTNH